MLPLVKGDVPEGDYMVPIGKSNVLREGDDMTVISYSMPLHFAMQAAEELRRGRHRSAYSRSAHAAASG